MKSIETAEPAVPLTPRDFIPLAATVAVVATAMLAQHLFIEAVHRWRER